jgi:ankyrin repeat protein
MNMDDEDEDEEVNQDELNRNFRGAIHREDVAKIQKMINAGYAVDTLIRGESGLHIAISRGSLIVVTALMNANASLDSVNRSGHFPLMTAVLSDEIDFQKNERHMGMFDVLAKKLISINPSWNLQTRSNVSPDGKTLLMVACQGGSVRMIRYFMKNNFDPRTVDHKGWNSLHHYVHRNLVDQNESLRGVVQILLRSLIGNELELVLAKDHLGNTPLHIAVQSEKNITKVIKPLLEYGANVACTNKKKQTPLHLAAFKGNFDTIAYLCSDRVGADVWAEDENGRTPLHCVLYCSPGARGFSLESTLVISIAKLLAEHVGLRRRSSYYNKPDMEGMTPFLLSCSTFGTATMNYFLKLPFINVDAMSRNGDTALHIAMHSQHHADVLHKLELLLPCISCIHRSNKNGETPMTIAKERIEDNEDFEQDVRLMEDTEARMEESSLAFAMGLHPRIGKESSMYGLDVEMAHMVKDALRNYIKSRN